MATQYILIQGRGQSMGGPTTSLAVAGISASAVASAGLSLSAVLHIFAKVSDAPIMAGASVSSPAWLSFWNIVLPVCLLGVTLVTYRSWLRREKTESQ